MARTSEGCELVLVVCIVIDDVRDGGPRVWDVGVIPPQVTCLNDSRVVGLNGDHTQRVEVQWKKELIKSAAYFVLASLKICSKYGNSFIKSFILRWNLDMFDLTRCFLCCRKYFSFFFQKVLQLIDDYPFYIKTKCHSCLVHALTRKRFRCNGIVFVASFLTYSLEKTIVKHGL